MTNATITGWTDSSRDLGSIFSSTFMAIYLLLRMGEEALKHMVDKETWLVLPTLWVRSRRHRRKMLEMLPLSRTQVWGKNVESRKDANKLKSWGSDWFWFKLTLELQFSFNKPEPKKEGYLTHKGLGTVLEITEVGKYGSSRVKGQTGLT